MSSSKTRVLTWEPATQERSTAEHNEMYQADSAPPGTYQPNMSREEELRWKAHHFKKSKDPRVEIRKRVGPALVVWVVRANGMVEMSANGKLKFDSYTDWLEMETAIAEALRVVRHG